MIRAGLKAIKANWWIGTIMLVAILLRTYNLTEIPYMHDELSALLRTHFDSYSEVLAKGIKVDGHPALVQSFLYFWTKLFGYEEWIVKLPFICLSVFSVFLIYRIGSRWYNVSAGLLLAAFFTCSEYVLMYGQIIRPYGSGLFFTLLMTFHWGEMVFFNRYSKKTIFLYILGGTLCSYNHHFSLLIAALIGIFGVFFVQKETRIKYILISLCIPILYLPHLSIFLYQLSVGGVEAWLGKPNSDFLPNYLDYIFHFSALVITVCVLVLLFGALNKRKGRLSLSKFQLFSLLLFLVNFAIGYYYSIYGAAVLQTSVLIFSFPFLMLFFAGFINEQSFRISLVLSGAILITLGYSLIWERRYYSLFYVPTFKQLVLDANQINKNYQTKTLFFTDLPKTKFYEPEIHISPNYTFIQVPDFSLLELDSLLQLSTKSHTYFCLAATSSFPPEYRALIQKYYPEEVETRNYFSASTILYKKGDSNPQRMTQLSPKNSKYWQGIDPKKWRNNNYSFYQGEE